MNQLREFLDEIQTGPVGINLDTATAILNGYNPVDVVRLFHDRLMHVTARDASRSRDGQGQETAIGRGEVDWEETLAVLVEAEYHGWITVQRTSGERQAIDMENAIRYLRTIGLRIEPSYGSSDYLLVEVNEYVFLLRFPRRRGNLVCFRTDSATQRSDRSQFSVRMDLW
ncbi:MAG: sugar phosphate isomerase/epimerase [Planctomycetaceae bacterium]